MPAVPILAACHVPQRPAVQQRQLHSIHPSTFTTTALLLLFVSCQVMTAGSDVTWDQTAELFSPPYLSKGPRPGITQAPSFHTAGADLAVKYESEDPVTRAILIRSGTATHSMNFGG